MQEKEIWFEIEDKNIVLVDDVLFTGRTTRAALDALFSHGRPRRVQLCVLVDRGHREIPVEATYVGRHVQTTMNEVIEVKLTEIDDAEKPNSSLSIRPSGTAARFTPTNGAFLRCEPVDRARDELLGRAARR